MGHSASIRYVEESWENLLIVSIQDSFGNVAVPSWALQAGCAPPEILIVRYTLQPLCENLYNDGPSETNTAFVGVSGVGRSR